MVVCNDLSSPQCICIISHQSKPEINTSFLKVLGLSLNVILVFLHLSLLPCLAQYMLSMLTIEFRKLYLFTYLNP